MKTNARFSHGRVLPSLIVAPFLLLPGSLRADVLYSQTFEGATLATVGFGYATLNMGGPALVREVTATGGVGGSQGFSHIFDGTGRPIYTISFSNILHPIEASDADPLPVSNAAKIRFSMDVKTVGSLTSTPIRMGISQTDENYEAERGIDANGDGDMTDFAIVFGSGFTPTVIDGGDYTHVSFTLDQGSIQAFIPRPGFPVIPLTPEFDPTVPLVWNVGFFSEGFGSDAGNIVSVDNILVETVPEPSTSVVLGIALVGLVPNRIRRQLGRC